MEFIAGLGMGMIGLLTIVGLVICVEENKKTNALIKNIKDNKNEITKGQILILNEMGVDLNKQKQS